MKISPIDIFIELEFRYHTTCLFQASSSTVFSIFTKPGIHDYYLIPELFHHSHKVPPHPSEVTPYFPFPPVPGNCQSTFGLCGIASATFLHCEFIRARPRVSLSQNSEPLEAGKVRCRAHAFWLRDVKPLTGGQFYMIRGPRNNHPMRYRALGPFRSRT